MSDNNDDNVITGRFVDPAQPKIDQAVLRNARCGTLVRELRNSADDIEKFGAVVERIQTEGFVLLALHQLAIELNARSDWIQRHLGE